MAVEYKYVTLPVGVVPKSVGFDAVVSMEINELTAQGWRAVSMTRSGIGHTPLSVLFERPIHD